MRLLVVKNVNKQKFYDMRTIEVKLYKFEELSEKAKENAISEHRSRGSIDMEWCYSEAHETVKKFCEVFGVVMGLDSWLDVRTGHIDDDILELSGLRLRKYIINNYFDDIYGGKYFSLWSKTDINPHFREGGHAPKGKLKGRHSKVMFTRDCPFTGVCYDYDILNNM